MASWRRLSRVSGAHIARLVQDDAEIYTYIPTTSPIGFGAFYYALRRIQDRRHERVRADGVCWVVSITSLQHHPLGTHSRASVSAAHCLHHWPRVVPLRQYPTPSRTHRRPPVTRRLWYICVARNDDSHSAQTHPIQHTHTHKHPSTQASSRLASARHALKS